METFSALLALCAEGIHRSPVNFPPKSQWRGALMFSLICAWINGWVNTRDAGDLGRHRAHYDVTVIQRACDAGNFSIPLSCARYIYIFCCICIPPHDDVTKWKHFSRHWPFVRRIHRPPVDSPNKGQWRRVLMFSLVCAWTNGWDAGDLRRHGAHWDVTAMLYVYVHIYVYFYM